MLTIETAPDGIVLLFADGQLTVSDYAYGVEQIAKSPAQAPPAGGLLIELGSGFTGWSVGAIWHSSRPEGDLLAQPRRIAVIGDDRWRSWADEAAGFAPMVPVRFFERHDRAAAAGWVREGDDAGAPD